MKICICTTPIRPSPTKFPPFGSMAIIQSLRNVGEDVSFYHIDYHRYKHEQISEYFSKNKFDMVGISAVVSTAYAYTKYLVKLINKVSPHTVIFVGGNLAASSKILHRKANVDYCVIGDGEIIVQNLVKAVKEKRTTDEDLKKVLGITFINSKDEFIFTGYDHPLPAPLIERPDWTIIEKDNSIDHYIYHHSEGFNQFTPHIKFKKGKRSAYVVVSKGCVARCTFCHRFEKGYRVNPLESIIEHIKSLMSKYDVGYLEIADENFGSYKDETVKLVKELGKLGLVWKARGVRAHTVDLEMLQLWKKNGCTNVIYGIESGSPKMLKVMEKKITLEQNIKALKETYQAGLSTCVSLVLGMPGETDETIDETIQFLLDIFPYYPDPLRNKINYVLNVNYAQSLPGTHLYEYAREHGYIEKGLDAEEEYLIRISDKDAYDNDHFINYTQQPLLKVYSWRTKIYWKLFREHARTHLKISLSKTKLILSLLMILTNKIFKTKLNSPLQKAFKKCESNDVRDAYINTDHYSVFQYGLKLLLPWNKLTYPFIAILIAYKESKNTKWFFKLIFEHTLWSLNIFKRFNLPKETLRKIVKIEDSDGTLPLREGR